MKPERDEMTTAIEKAETTFDLMQKAQEGDRAAFDRLSEVCRARGRTIEQILSSRSSTMLVNKLKDRASKRNLLARAAVAGDLASAADDLADRSDGPIERLIIGRAALCATDASLSEREYQHAAANGGAVAPIEALDRRRERSQRMLLAALKTLAAVRRMNRPAVQVNVGDGNMNVLKA